jgi:hypothetical protein
MEKYFDWNEEKDMLLQHVRGIGFADVITCIQKGGRLATIKHPHPEK